MDEYGSVTHCITDYPRQQFFMQLKTEFIDSKTFGNIYIISPDIFAKWWVWDVLNDVKGYVEVSREAILAQSVPYVLSKTVFDRIKRLLCKSIRTY